MIDSHVHIGKYGKWESNLEQLIFQMKEFGIKFAIASDLNVNTFNPEGMLMFPDKTQIELNELALNTIKPYLDRLKLLFWIRPKIDQVNTELINYLKEHKEFVGLKVHPVGARLKISESNYHDYIKLCGILDFPFCIHTENDGLSNIEYVYEIAKRHPKVRFVAVHMNLGTNHESAYQFIKECDNLFGDTTLVNTDDVLRAIEVCGSEKILFGTDASIFKERSYLRYKNLYQEIVNKFGMDAANNVFENNARKVFRI